MTIDNLVKNFILKGIKFKDDKEQEYALKLLEEKCFDIKNVDYGDIKHKIFVCDKLIPTYPNENRQLDKQIYEKFLKYLEIHQGIFC